MKKLMVSLLMFIQIYFTGMIKMEAKPLASTKLESVQGTFNLSIQELTSIKCNGGYGILRALVTVTSGTVSGIQYSWSGGGNSKDILKLAGTYTVTVTTSNSGSKTATYTLKEPTQIYLNGLEIMDGCAGGNAKIGFSIKGGVSPYILNIYNSKNQNVFASAFVSNYTGYHPQDSYTIKIRDSKGCDFIENVILKTTTKAFTNPGIVSTPPRCFQFIDGKILSTPEQIVPGVTKEFNWILKDVAGKVIHTDCCNTFSMKDELKAGTYTLEVTMSNCLCPKLIKTFTITQPSQLVSTGQISEVDCFGNATGEIVLNTVGGNGGYHYDWSNGASTKDNKGLVAGTYHVTVTDAKNCITNPATLTFIVIQPDKIENTEFVTKDAICFGQRNGEIFQNIKGGKKPYNYLWQDGAQTSDREKLLKGKYACNITDVNKCKSTFTYTINEPDELIQTVDTIIAQTTIKKGAIILKVEGGYGQYYFDWSGPNVFKAGTRDIFDVEHGDYVLSIQDDNGCINEKKYTVPFNSATSIHDLSKVYFKQIQDRILFKHSPLDLLHVASCIRVDGSFVNIPIDKISNEEFSLDISGILPGIYFIQIGTVKNSSTIKVSIH
ncbi:MAG: SprB repeat-containing protein [Saprospiraceae bacterium]|nr:SprB repeat-containing protein [Saprospiraceae bacterium]